MTVASLCYLDVSIVMRCRQLTTAVGINARLAEALVCLRRLLLASSCVSVCSFDFCRSKVLQQLSEVKLTIEFIDFGDRFLQLLAVTL